MATADQPEPTTLTIVDPGALSRSNGGLEAVAPTDGPADGGPPFTLSEQIRIARAFEALREASDRDGAFGVADDRLASLIQAEIAEHPERYLAQTVPFERQATDGPHYQEAKFDHSDPGWYRALVPWLRSALKRPARDDRPPCHADPAPIPPDAKLALFGDWGTGDAAAVAVSDRITHHGDYDVAVHLGDTYYVGSEKEIRGNLVAHLPRPKAGGLVRLCSSNHEMYSGGKPFYDIALPAVGQESTVFALQNDDWLFLGLDTGFKDGRIDDEQQAWLAQAVAAAGTRRLVLLCHHNPWSTGERADPDLVEDLAPAFAHGVTAWYWGHVHACELYEPTAVGSGATTAMHGRCIGHGGFPYRRLAVPQPPTITTDKAGTTLHTVAGAGERPTALVLDGPNEHRGDEWQDLGPNGFLRLELRGRGLVEVLYAPDGTELWRGTIA